MNMSAPTFDDRKRAPRRRLPAQPILDVVEQVDRVIAHVTTGDEAIE
jgi:hypothetical protein